MKSISRTEDEFFLPDTIGELDDYIEQLLKERPPRGTSHYTTWVWRINEVMTKCNALASSQGTNKQRWRLITL